MRRIHRIIALALVLGLGFAAAALAAGAANAASTSPIKVYRWESNTSIGGTRQGHLAIVKSFWWFALPKVFALGLSFDYVADFVPLVLNVALNAPIPVVVPFVCAGVGGGLNVSGITTYGGGLKVRLGRKIGLIAEYRKCHYSKKTFSFPPRKERFAVDYFGAGIAWRF